MSNSYRVTQPCAYVSDGAATVHRKPGAVVELNEAVAAELGDAVQLVGGATSKPKRGRNKEAEAPSAKSATDGAEKVVPQVGVVEVGDGQ